MELKKIIMASALIGLSILTVMASAGGRDDQVPVVNQSARTNSSLLFVLSAKSGEITRSGKTYSLTLKNVDHHVVWFTDRPIRQAGFVLTKAFIAHWNLRFKSSPPNAAMVHVGMTATINKLTEPMAVELLSPKLTDGQLLFTVRRLKGDFIRVGTLKTVRVFIDSADDLGFTSLGMKKEPQCGACHTSSSSSNGPTG